MDKRYRHSRHSVSYVGYHFIWIPRRRRKVLVGPVADRLEALLREQTDNLNLAILELAIQPDHVHLFVQADPTFAPYQIMFRLKGATARVLRKEFDHLRKMPSMWTSAYFVSTIGQVSADTIQRYIAEQSSRA